MTPATYGLLADLILVVHFAIVLFIAGGLLAIVVGRFLNWPFIFNRWFRLLHLIAIGIVALQALLGQLCPLTIWEQALRQQAGQPTYSESFVQHWLHQLMFFDAPLWVFALLYTAVAVIVLGCWLADRNRLHR